MVLGPAGDYEKLVRKMAAEQLKDKGVVAAGKRKGIVLGVDKDIQTLAYLVESFQTDLAQALGRRQSLRREAEFRAKRVGRPAVASKTDRERLEKLRNEADEADRERKEQDARIAAARTTFVESVAALRKGIEESRRKHEELAADSDARRATALLKLRQKKGGVHMAPTPRSPQALLEQSEKLIRTETVSLEPDKSICWADVVLNDQSACKMVVDPAVETVRIPASLAAAMGLRADDRAGEPLTAASGPAAAGQHAVLASVRIGSITLDDVDCLILPEGDGSPPILGAGFLDQFVSRFDPDAATLTLTRVDVKPSTARPAARAKC